MLTSPDLEKVLQANVGTTRPFNALCWRATPLAYGFDPLGTKRPLSAGRFNLKGSARVLYVAVEPETALAESTALSGYPVRAVALVPLKVRLVGVHSLLDGTPFRKQIKLTKAELALNFRFVGGKAGPAPTQTLGEACAALKTCEALVYPSQARPGGTCLAIFEASLTQAKSIEVDDPSVRAVPGLISELP